MVTNGRTLPAFLQNGLKLRLTVGIRTSPPSLLRSYGVAPASSHASSRLAAPKRERRRLAEGEELGSNLLRVTHRRRAYPGWPGRFGMVGSAEGQAPANLGLFPSLGAGQAFFQSHVGPRRNRQFRRLYTIKYPVELTPAGFMQPFDCYPRERFGPSKTPTRWRYTISQPFQPVKSRTHTITNESVTPHGLMAGSAP